MYKDSSEETPYSTNTNLEGPQFSEPARAFIRAPITAGSWRKHSSAMNCFFLYKFSLQNMPERPLTPAVVCGFAAWALSSKELKPSTV
jgi:hypothetical protein